DVQQFKFHGAQAEALQYTATFADGNRMQIVVPKDRVKGLTGDLLRLTGLQGTAVEMAQRTDWLGGVTRSLTGLTGQNYTVGQVADAVGHLPQESRQQFRQVVVNTVQNPDDAYWAKAYKMKDFRSYMTSGAAGVTEIYPADSAHRLAGTEYMRISLLHESGHIYSDSHWGGDPNADTPGWTAWRAAEKADGGYVSRYATSSPAEDFAETFAAYFSTKGTPRFAAYRAKAPHRFAILDAVK
ncbi:MAG: hypothetical protein KGL53_07090, partial [Elusimicrobia bacterium]|nr:hypothetical protein [Elusimicrobiota bacterium]